jgi:hypothetical protein
MSVDDEVRRNCERQAEHTNDVFDYPVGCYWRKDMPAISQRRRIGRGQIPESLQLINAPGDAETMQAADS